MLQFVRTEIILEKKITIFPFSLNFSLMLCFHYIFLRLFHSFSFFFSYFPSFTRQSHSTFAFPPLALSTLIACTRLAQLFSCLGSPAVPLALSGERLRTTPPGWQLLELCHIAEAQAGRAVGDRQTHTAGALAG